jgi:hypothetical protein
MCCDEEITTQTCFEQASNCFMPTTHMYMVNKTSPFADIPRTNLSQLHLFQYGRHVKLVYR